jgi:hypothetical protein
MKIVSPLFKFLTKYSEFLWNIHFQSAFETLKEKISVVLEMLDHVVIDANGLIDLID